MIHGTYKHEVLNGWQIASYSHSLTFLFHSSCFQFSVAEEEQVMSCTIQTAHLCSFTAMVSTLTFRVSCTLLLSCNHCFCVCDVSPAGTDVMLLDNFSTDGSSHPQHHGNPSGKRRSSVTFEDQVEHSKGIRRLPAPQ